MKEFKNTRRSDSCKDRWCQKRKGLPWRSKLSRNEFEAVPEAERYDCLGAKIASCIRAIELEAHYSQDRPVRLGSHLVEAQNGTIFISRDNLTGKKFYKHALGCCTYRLKCRSSEYHRISAKNIIKWEKRLQTQTESHIFDTFDFMSVIRFLCTFHVNLQYWQSSRARSHFGISLCYGGISRRRSQSVLMSRTDFFVEQGYREGRNVEDVLRFRWLFSSKSEKRWWPRRNWC